MDKNGIPALGELYKGWVVKLDSKDLNHHLVHAFGEGRKEKLKITVLDVFEETDEDDYDYDDSELYECPECDGAGMDSDGDVCGRCDGMGSVEWSDDDDGDWDEDSDSCDGDCDGGDCESCTNDECCQGDLGSGMIESVLITAMLDGKLIGDSEKGFGWKNFENIHAFNRFLNVLCARYEW